MAREQIEVYTCKYEVTIQHRSATLAITISAQRGTVEEVNEAMNTVAQTIRQTFPKDAA